MPEPSLYRSGYHLEKGMVLAGYKLIDIQVDHITVIRYHDYTYPTRMSWQAQSSDANPQQLLSALNQQVQADRTINSSYGNPYQCHFGTPTIVSSGSDISQVVVIQSEGSCHRVYH